ncbi:MAG: energy-coupling factor ABC transporter ATP-binding protein [Treponema sp.]|jgi:biotin transport system ATP-binding protein|nr:energy-coupling factor ABC transporter ATP-binding protein [Treponema sp.]
MDAPLGSASPSAPLFSLRGISHVFPNGNKALSDITLDIHEEECLFITGSNGSGKTLLIRIACGLVEPSCGDVFFHGIPLDRARDVRSSVGMVFQDADSQIVGETVAEDIAFGPKNLRLPKDEIAERVHSALSAMGLTEKRDYPPRRLSGGEKRRLAVAGILAMGCSAIIMDEPFANLDYHGVVQVLDIIKHMKTEEKTIIILTHELEKALAYADRLVILDKGRIRDQGRADETLDRLVPSYGVRDPRKTYTCAADCTWLD